MRSDAPEPPRVLQVGQVTAVAWPAQLELAAELAREAARPSEWPGLGLRTVDSFRLIVVPDARRLDSLTRGRAPTWAAAERWTLLPTWAQLPTKAWESMRVPSST